jgi:hypothetical protein
MCWSPLLAALALLLLFRALEKESGGHWELLAAGVLTGSCFADRSVEFCAVWSATGGFADTFKKGTKGR